MLYRPQLNLKVVQTSIKIAYNRKINVVQEHKYLIFNCDAGIKVLELKCGRIC